MWLILHNTYAETIMIVTTSTVAFLVLKPEYIMIITVKSLI